MEDYRREKKKTRAEHWRELWPGCGIGLCMFCGDLTRVDDGADGFWLCGHWIQSGERCPDEPHFRHKWHKVTCAVCGTKRQWVLKTNNSSRFSTLKEAKVAGWKRRDVELEK